MCATCGMGGASLGALFLLLSKFLYKVWKWLSYTYNFRQFIKVSSRTMVLLTLPTLTYISLINLQISIHFSLACVRLPEPHFCLTSSTYSFFTLTALCWQKINQIIVLARAAFFSDKFNLQPPYPHSFMLAKKQPTKSLSSQLSSQSTRLICRFTPGEVVKGTNLRMIRISLSRS